MTDPLRTLVIGYRTRLAACQRPVASGCALAVAAMTVALPQVASAQRAGGSIGVSLTIVPPIAAPIMAVSDFRLDRDGIVTIRTTPITAQDSRLVMTRASSSTNGSVPDRYMPVLPCDARESDYAARGVWYRVDVGRPEESAAPRAVELRIEYLVVAGT